MDDAYGHHTAPVTPPADAIAQVNGFIQRFGTTVGAELDALDDTGFAEMRCGPLSIGLNTNLEHGTLLLLSRVGDLPTDPTPDFYRRLLSLNLLATGQCAFAIDESRHKLYLRAMRPLHGFSYEEFETLLHNLAAVTERMLQTLQGSEIMSGL